MKKKDLLNQVAEAGKNISRGRRHVENAARLSDPAINAELQHSLQAAGEELFKAGGAFDKAAQLVTGIGQTIFSQFPDDVEEPVAAAR